MTQSGIQDAYGTTWKASCPSNIAFLKYWGKRDPALQWPANDSLSMTLTNAKTITSARRRAGGFDSFQFQDKLIDSVTSPQNKVFLHLNRLRNELNLEGHLHIHSENTFPSDCGIASSASGFAALTMAGIAALLETNDWNELALRGASKESIAHWARLGSGSAGRSCFGGFVQWTAGENPTSQKIAPLYPASHWDLCDVIVILDDDKKSMSSSEAHLAAWGSPLFKTRLAGIPERLRRMRAAIEIRDVEKLGVELEAECLEMHSVAMTGTPAVCYLKPETTEFTTWVREQRSLGWLPAWFTIDAGPNVHLICERQNQDLVVDAINKKWRERRTKIMIDRIGEGPMIQRGE